MRIKPDYWQSFYSGALEPNEERSPGKYRVELDAEVEPSKFGAREVGSRLLLRGAVAFVDGVRRIDLHAIVEDLPPHIGLFGSVATGAMVMEESQSVGATHGSPLLTLQEALRHVQVSRLFLTNAPDPTEGNISSLATSALLGSLRYEVRVVRSSEPQAFNNALMNRMAELESDTSARLFKEEGVAMVISDGPIPFERSAGSDTSKLVGLIKSVRELYLPREQLPVLARLHLGERSHLFAIRYEDARTSKLSCFVRLQGVSAFVSSFANLVRLEIPLMARSQAISLADSAAAIAIHYASNVYADARAPQNLYPVAALEAALKNRLGDPRLLRNRLLTTLGASPEESGQGGKDIKSVPKEE
ncbi:MAG: hypothetical protein NTV14_00860 [Coprothermobacterota bacterium]|nr:hypothetical protein [Coprothermobacterota bacterium]